MTVNWNPSQVVRTLVDRIIQGAQVQGLLDTDSWLAEQEMKDRWSQLLEEKISKAWPE